VGNRERHGNVWAKRLRSRAGAFVALSLLASAAGVVGAAPSVRGASSPTWRVDSYPSPQVTRPVVLSSVSCVDGDQCVAAGYAEEPTGNHALVERRNGTSWTLDRVPQPAGASDVELAGVSCAAVDDCVAVGHADNAALIERYDGAHWSIEATLGVAGATTATLRSVSCVGASWCVAVGETDLGSLTETWNGDHWTVVAPSADSSPGSILTAVSCASPARCVAVGDDGFSAVAISTVWDGTAWHGSYPPGINADDVECRTGVGCMEVGADYLGSTTAVFARLTGDRWTPLRPPVQRELFAVSCPTAGVCAIVSNAIADGTVLNVGMGRHWSRTDESANRSQFEDVTCTSATRCWAVGWHYNPHGQKLPIVDRWNGSSWVAETVALPTGDADTDLSDVACASTSRCMAVGGYALDHSDGAPLVEQLRGGSWTATALARPQGQSSAGLDAVSCVDPSFCMAVGFGQVLNGSRDAAFAERWNGTQWTASTFAAQTGGAGSLFWNVACTSRSNCFAVGAFGPTTNLPLIMRWDGSRWQRVDVPAPSGARVAVLSDIACPSSMSCIAVGSADTDTLVEQWNGTQWAQVAGPIVVLVQSSAFRSVSCATASACLAFGDLGNGPDDSQLAARYDGASWSTVNTAQPAGAAYTNLGDVSCSAADDCLAVGTYNDGSASHALAEHYDGTGFTQDTVPALAGPYPDFAGTDCVGGTCVVVGGQGDAHESALILERASG
jgi:hypothetical protein